MALHLHEDRKKTQAPVPYNNLFFAALDNFRINQRPGLCAGKLQKDHALQYADLRRRNPAPIACFRPPVCQRIGKIANHVANHRR